ncbi:aldo/keto reductase [Actinocorallia sp. A-T 12471]|uniref:aldo/keto reductase n=1 Tax=Actinocorallia sp. A-T 12471 TaxID=3089813 RepID=UPI0029D25147|nr:aldo/keto reductase [Actinocorallia sp. A-T 12471]MDX6740098.1 aldo/keto reductase [Actinocorallia sp. A-T 12471]
MGSPLNPSGEFRIGDGSRGKVVRRLGYGAMRITGPGVWGEPADREEALRVLRHAVELGVDLIDTADSYGPHVSEELIREALFPYTENLLIATKAGFVRTGPHEWHVLAEPNYLRQQVELSLRRLRLERIELFQLHRIDERFPIADQVGVLRDMRDEGKIGAIGLSEVNVAQIEEARRTVEIATVQNRYNLIDRASEEVLVYCAEQGIGFIPWNPVAAGGLTGPGTQVQSVADETGATPSQVALAWLLAKSPVMLPIPGTSSSVHLEENMAASTVQLTPEQIAALDAVA